MLYDDEPHTRDGAGQSDATHHESDDDDEGTKNSTSLPPSHTREEPAQSNDELCVIGLIHWKRSCSQRMHIVQPDWNICE